MKTATEKAIQQHRRTRGGILVPLIHDYFRTFGYPRIQTEEDARWLQQLGLKIAEREQERTRREVEGKTVFGPSSLGSCIRQVYLKRHWKKLGMTRLETPAIEPGGYFFEGDWKHLKWQFMLYKLGHVLEDFWLIDCEVPVYAKKGDHGGSIDVICLWEGVPYAVDIKGLNTRSFQMIVRGEVPHNYRIQVTDYMLLKNNEQAKFKRFPEQLAKLTGVKSLPRIEKGILLVENKGGPDMNHPLALHESIISYRENLPEVQARLGVLREHEAKEEIPEPECVSTKGLQFQGCPFRDFCKEEVKAIEKRRGKSASRNARGLRVAKPERSDSSRRPRAKRRKG